MGNNKFFTVREMSEIFEIPGAVIRSWIVDGRLKGYRVGGKYRIKPQDILDYLAGLNNPKSAMANFKKDIEEYLKQKYEATK